MSKQTPNTSHKQSQNTLSAMINSASPTNISLTQISATMSAITDSYGNDVKYVSWELMSLTYGVFVKQLVQDFNHDMDKVNEELMKMGRNIGLRLIEDIQVKLNIPRCQNMSDLANTMSKVVFKHYLGIAPSVVDWNANNTEFSLVIENDPLTEFVELDDNLKSSKLFYLNILCGVISGCCQVLQLDVDCKIVKDALLDDERTEIRCSFKKINKNSTLVLSEE